MTIAIVAILVIVILVLLLYNIKIHKQIQTFNNINQKIINLNILQDFMNTIGNNLTVDEKIEKINNILIEKYDIKYSTIVIYDGTEYQIKATNVDSKHWQTLRSLQDVEIFKDSILTANPKYVTVNNNKEKLPYQQMEFDRAKSAIFFPLYIDNIYIGYWIIESGVPHDFDNIDETIFEAIKENIVTVLKTVTNQRILESIVRKDTFTGLNTAEYLYGDGKKEIDQYTTSTMCMFRITNIEEINQKFSRELGNEVIIEIADKFKQNLAKEYIFVRYMGPKFVIAFSGAEPEATAGFLEDIKSSLENMNISLEKDSENQDQNDGKKTKKSKKDIPQETTAKLNFVLSKYYKGTGIEEVLKKLETYIDNANKEENNITII